MAALDLKGQKFGRLTVLERAENTKANKSKWLCKCDCGNLRKVVGSNLKNGMTKSCGCLERELNIQRSTRHGLESTRICHVWRNIKARCQNPKNTSYKNYGGRGITICEEWLGENGLKNFAQWAYENGYDENAEKGKCTIDRIDNNKGYYPENCRWVDLHVQANNKRNNVLITYNGRTQTLEQWCKELNLSRSMVKHRYERGWSTNDLFLENKRISKR